MNFKQNLPPYPIDFDLVMRSAVFRMFIPTDSLDTVGRPIMEGRSILHPPGQEEYRICPYKGSRYKHTKSMNVGALNHLMSQASNVEACFSQLSYLIQTETNQLSWTTIEHSSFHLLKVGHTGFKAPLAWLISNWTGTPAICPPVIAAVAKISEGIAELALNLLKNKVPGNVTCSARQLYQHADCNGNLIGLREVCAGPPQMIENMLDSMIHPAPFKQGKARIAELIQPFSMMNILELAALTWSAQAVAIVYNYCRLSLLQLENDKIMADDDFFVTFPKALELLEVVQQYVEPKSTSLGIYFESVWMTEQTRKGCIAAGEFLQSSSTMKFDKPGELSVTSHEWADFHAAAIQAMSEINSNIDELHLFKLSSQEVNPWLFELMFGQMPFQSNWHA